jgi:hypothetical protein
MQRADLGRRQRACDAVLLDPHLEGALMEEALMM